MYAAPPPQSVLRVGSANDKKETNRLYKVWRGHNKFFLGGRLIFGPDVRSLLPTILLIVGPVGIFCGCIASELLDKFPHHLGVLIMVVAIIYTFYVLILLLLTSARDPGIIPRNEHPPEEEDSDAAATPPAEWGAVLVSRLRLPRTKDVMVNGIVVKIKFCDTCMLYRPPRCSHCSICNNCVERFDHHCPWVGQCIGQRNYRFFFMFVFSTTILCVYVFAFCWVLIKKIMEGDRVNLWKAMSKTPASIILIVYTFIAVWFVGGLTAFHIYLISTNQTTYENFRYRYDSKLNPYNRGWLTNFKEIFFTKISPSKNDFREKVRQNTPGYGVHNPTMDSETFSTDMGKVVTDHEMGVKSSWSPVGIDSTDDPEGLDTRNVMHPRRSSWGRKSGSWEITPDILALTAEIGGEGSRNGLKTSPANQNEGSPKT
uniref:S-acyltransferase n=1 Tax=Wollemia nobilis TaxID=56998 RepID=A0A0C9S986_9CONI